MEAIHVYLNGEHSGIQGTYQKAKGILYWKGLKKAIHNYVTMCDTCQKNKAERTHPTGLL